MTQRITQKTDAYFTVEAALVLPFVIAVVLLVIYLLLFQYNRCLMEQEAGVLSLRGCTLQMKDREKLVQRLMIEWEKDDKAYPAWRRERAGIRLQGNRLRVEWGGNLQFPFKGFSFWSPDNIWESSIVYETRCTDPVNLIRNYRKIKGGK